MARDILLAKQDIEEIVNRLFQKLGDGSNPATEYDKIQLTFLACRCYKDRTRITKFKNDLKHDSISRCEAFTQVLKEWVASCDEVGTTSATLGNLISLFSKDELPNICEILEFEYLGVQPKSLCQEESKVIKNEPSSSSTTPSNSMESALENSLIFEKLWDKISFPDKKSFRLVCRLFFRESLAFWRRSLWIRIGNMQNTDSTSVFQHHPCHMKPLGLQEFYDLFHDSNEEWVGDPLRLLDYPYHKYKITNVLLQPPHASRTKPENVFWSVCGSQMTHIEIQDCKFNQDWGILRTLQWLLQDECPQLSSLDIQDNNFDRRYQLDEDDFEDDWAPVAENLNKLTLNTPKWSGYIYRGIFKLLPGLMTLQILDPIGMFGARGVGNHIIDCLLIPTVVGHMIQLRELEISHAGVACVTALKKYTEILPNCIKYLKIKGNGYNGKQFMNANLYCTLAQCHSLRELSLEFFISDITYLPSYYADLSSINFPNLIKFSLGFELDYGATPRKFDWGSLGGMQKLEDFSLEYKRKFREDVIILVRQPKAADYLYDGPLDLLVPGGEQIDYFGKAPRLKTLKKLRFDGWQLNTEDVKLFARWFPKLICLEARLDGEGIAVACESWRNLETLFAVTNECKIKLHLGQLLNAKLRHERVQIIVQNTDDITVEAIQRNDGQVFLNGPTASGREVSQNVKFYVPRSFPSNNQQQYVA